MGEEVRPGDVLRLFFGETVKHYLVVKVGRDTVDLRHETGTDTLLHEGGRLVSVGKAAVTGFVVLRDPTLFGEFVPGAFVEVTLHGGQSFKGVVLENDEGMLKVRAPTGHAVYVDLANSDGPVRRVVLSETLDEADAPLTADLPEDLPELQLQAVGLQWSALMAPPAKPSPLLPRWLMPVLDASKIERRFLRKGKPDDTPARAVLEGEPCKERTTAVLLNSPALKKGTLPVVFETFDSGEPLPAASLAAIPELFALSRVFQRGTSLYDRVRYHRALHLFYRAWRTRKAKKYDCLSAVLAAVSPPIPPRATSLYALLKALEPYPGRAAASVQLKLPPSVDDPAPFPPAQPPQTRHMFGKDYGGFAPPELFTSEALTQVLYLDQGRRYLHAPSEPIPALQRSRQGAEWARERRWQALRNASAKPGDPAFVGVVNLLYSTDAKVADACLAEYGRSAKPDEDAAWLYHTVTGAKLFPSAAERVLSAGLRRGKTGRSAALERMALVREDGWLIDPSSGFLFTAAPRVAEPQQKEGK